VTTHVLLALVVVLVVSRALAAVFSRFKQPAVIGEIVAGIVIGPSVLGHFVHVIPDDAVAPLGVIAQIGIVLFMFLVGLELDVSLLKKRTRASIAISASSIVVPFALGLALAAFLRERFAPPGVPHLVFALFIAVSMSVTAFPVLARILSDRGMTRTPLGTLALACAAVDDVTAWCLLALVVSLARSHASSAAATVAMVAVFGAVMIGVARPLLRRTIANAKPTANTLALVLAGLLASALVTEVIGVHALFGAFVFGAILPHDSPLARAILDKLTDFVVVLLLPAFFAFTGLRTKLGLVHGDGAWLACALITLAATVGKFGGSFFAAKLTGLGTRDAASLGVLMNTRGLMELVVLNVGYDLGIVSDTLFAMLVSMAIVTTFATTPILQWLEASRRGAESTAHQEA
jgi:Kef-type K+ transport system membrane component KefB